MPNPVQNFSTTALTNAAESGNNAETVVATLTGVIPQLPGQTVRLAAWAVVTVGTGTTAGTLRIRKGSLTGTVVGPANADSQGIAASKVCEIQVQADDVPGEGTFTYVVTYQGTGDTAVTNFTSVRFNALVS